MITAVLSGFLVVLVIPLLTRFLQSKAGFALALLPAALFLYFGRHFLNGTGQDPIGQSFVWNQYFDLQFAFYLDGLSLLFSLLITGIGALIFVYAASYMKGHAHQARFYIFLSVFMASMLGLVLADNLLTLMVFWELTSITSFMLIGFENTKDEARASAYQALLVTGLGGLGLLASLVLMGQVGGTYSISEILNNPEAIKGSSLYLPILLCFLLGAFTKSAQVPFHFWLPNAMAAPTPVSAYLHSATMVKAGVYIVARFFPALGGTLEWQLILGIFGAITMLTGAVLSFRSTDLKHILAYATVSALGIMMLSFGIGTETGLKAGLGYVIAHALYKSTLFMIAGIVDHETGTRDVRELPKKLFKSMKLTAAVALLAGLSFAGIIPFFGFIAKELLLKMALTAPQYSWVITAVKVTTATFFVAIVWVLIHAAFFRGSGTRKASLLPKHTPYLFHLAPAVTALAGLYFGIFSDLPSELLTHSTTNIDPDISKTHLALWHGWNHELMLSIISIFLGSGLYFAYPYLQRTGRMDMVLKPINPSVLYHKSIANLTAFAKWQTGKLQSGYLRHYVMIMVLTILAITGFTFFYKAGLKFDFQEVEMYIFELVLGLIMIIALVVILALRSQIGSVLAMGIVAIGAAIIFLGYGAPDLAITWFLVDTLTVTLFVLIIHKLPKKVVPKSKLANVRDAAIALGIGALMTCILFTLTSDPLDSKLKDFYALKSYSEAHGKNIVNVILVDFRALDTFGEITVLTIAALGVYSMIDYSRKPLKKRA